MANTRTVTCPNLECRRSYIIATLTGGWVAINDISLRWHGPRRLNIRCGGCGRVLSWGANQSEQAQADQAIVGANDLTNARNLS